MNQELTKEQERILGKAAIYYTGKIGRRFIITMNGIDELLTYRKVMEYIDIIEQDKKNKQAIQ